MKVQTRLTLNTTKPLKNGKYTLSVRVYYNGQTRYYSTKHKLTPKEYKALSNKRLTPQQRSIIDNTNKDLDRANNVINDLEIFSFQAFKRGFVQKNNNNNTDIIEYIKIAIKKKEDNMQISSAQTTQAALNQLKTYIGGKDKLQFKAVTVDFLREYERYMLLKDFSKSTVNSYMRTLSTAFNTAIRQNVINHTIYPFKHYTPPNAVKRKQSLSIKELTQIHRFKTTKKHVARARDIFLLLYNLSGMNIGDLCRLRHKDFDKERGIIIYRRNKTNHTARKELVLELNINEFTAKCIKKYGNTKENDNTYLFNFSNGATTERDLKKKIDSVKTLTNLYLRVIKSELRISKQLSTNVARSTYAQHVLSNTKNIQAAQQALLHSNMNTTQIYLDSINNEEQQNINKELTHFLNG